MAQFAIDEVLTTGIQISGFIFDYSNRLGTAGQVLTSTTSGVMWQADSSIVDLSSLSGQIAATGSLLNNRINSLSGYSDATFATITNLATTGSTLNTKINTLSGYSNANFATITNLAATGSTLDTKINTLSGYSNNSFATITNLAATGSALDTKINTLSGYSNANFATILNLAATGSTLDTKINALSGYSNANFATVLNLAATGSTLNAKINSLSGYEIQTFLSGSGTQYYVPRWNTSKELVTGSIYDNGNVGIGTTSPSTKLEVQGNGQFGNDSVTNIGLKITRLNGGMRTSEHTYHSSQNSPWYTYGQNLTWTNELAGTVESTQAYRPYFEGFAPAAGYKVFGFMNVTTGSFTSTNVVNSLVLKNDGNVGIGTVSPTTLLSVGGAGSTSAASGLTFGGDASANLYRISDSRIKTDGSLEAAVGIISPTITSLSGNIAATGSTLDTKINTLSGYSNVNFATILNLAATGSTLDTKINTLSGYSNANFATILNLAATGSTLDTKINTTNTNLAATGSTLNTKINTLSGYANSTFLSGQGVANWTARWNGTKELITGSIYDLGTGIGIGTTSPVSLLTVGAAGSTSAVNGISFGGDAQANLYRTTEDTIRTDGALIAGTYLRALNYVQLLTNLYPDSFTDYLKLNVGNSAGNAWEDFPVVIKRGAYVGIGTDMPTGKLHVVSSVAGGTVFRADGTNGTLFSVTDDLSDSLMSVNNSAGLPVFEVFADDRVVAGQYGSGDFVLVNNKVGIGTTNPTYKLHVLGDTLISGNLTNPTIIGLSGALNITGSTLDTKINSLSGYSNANFATILNLAATGSVLDTKINTTNTNLAATGSTLDTKINTTNTNLAATGSTLDTKINTLSGYSNANFATILNLAATGSVLDTKINTLSGYSNANFATILNLAATGSTLDARINSLSGYAGSTFLSGQGVANWTARWNGTKELITGSIYDLGTGIGIGTISPGTKLDVVGAVTMPVIKQSTTLYAGTDITDDNSTRTVYFNIPEGGYSPAKYFKVARIKITGNYQNVSLNGYFTAVSAGVHVGFERKVEFDFIAYAATNAGAPTVTYLKRGPDTTNVLVYAVANGGGAGTTYYDVYIKNAWYNDTNGELAIRVGYGSAVTVWQAGLDSGTSAPVDTLVNPNSNYAFDTAGNVGIGTTNPSTKLHLYEASAADVTLRLTPSNGAYDPVFQMCGQDNNITSEGFEIWYDNDVGDVHLSTTYAADGASIHFHTRVGASKSTSNERLTILGNGKVGIGTASPTTLLSVGGVGSASAASGITFGGDSVVNLYRLSDSVLKTDAAFTAASLSSSSYVYASTYLQTAGGQLYAGAPYGTLTVYVGNTAQNAWEAGLYVGRGSYVGIGTTQPSGKLHVVSTVAGETVLRADGTNGTLFSVVDDLSDSLMSVNNSAGLPVLEVFADDRIVAGQYGSGDFVLVNNKVGIGTSNPVNKLSVIGAASIGSTSYNIAAPSNGLIVEGSAGIGTTNPAYKLDVNGTSRFANDILSNGNITIAKASAYLYLNGTNSDAELRFLANSSDRWAMGMNVGDATENLNIYNYTTATTNFTILKANGNVGIGTATPLQKLQVDGVVGNPASVGVTQSGIFRISNTTDNAVLDFGIRAGGLGAWIQSTDETSLAANYPLLLNPNGGNVGVGLTNPAAVLNVKTSTTANREVFMGDSNAVVGVFRARLDDNSLSFISLENRDINTVTDHGVGIRFNLGTNASNNAINAGGIYLGKEQTWTATASTQDSYLTFNTALDGTAVEKVRITSAGNVGIGVTNPSNKLQISGGGISFTTSTGLAVQMIGIVLPTNIGYIGPYNSPADGNSPTVVALNHAASVQQTWFYSSGRIAMSLNREGRFHIGDLNNAPNCLLSVGPTSTTTAVSGMCFGNDASANLYRSAASTITTDGNLYVAGTTVLQGDKYFTTLKSVFLVARGTGANNSASRYLAINNTAVYTNTSRGLRLTIINATSLAVVSNTDYDTYGSDAACDDLATAINGMTSQQIGVLTSYDAWERDRASLRTAALNVGLTKLGTCTTHAAIRKPYAAIFNGTSDTTNATTKHVIERMDSSDADASRALITTYLTTDGSYASIDAALHMPNALYASDADIEYPIVAVNSVGNVGIGTTFGATKLEVYGVLRVTESSSGGILQLSAGASNVDIASTFYGGSRRPLTFTVDSERMRIQADGRVGIGTATALAQLHVTGQTYLTNVVANVARNQLTINANGANYAHFYDVGVSANNAIALGGNGAIGTVPTKAIMSWRLSTENVGIGLTNPEATSALHIKNLDAAAKVTIESADGSESLINFSAQASEYSVGFVRDGSSVNSLRFCAADNLSSNEVMRLQNGNVGIGLTTPLFKLDNYNDTFRSLSRVSEKIIAVTFPNAVANQKVDIVFDVAPGTVVFWGNLEIEITDEFSNQLATGKLIKVFALGLNPATGSGPYGSALYDNTSYYTAAYGAVADNYAIDGIFFNTTTGKYYFTIIHRTSTGNVPVIKIKGFTKAIANSDNINNLTAGAVYTTNTTVYYRPVVETLQSRIGYNGNINQSADLIVQGDVGIGTTSPNGIFHAANIKTLGTTADNFHGYFSSVNRNCNVYILATNTQGSYLYFGDGDSNTVGALVYEHSANYLRVDVSGSERMRIVSDGKVGIGTVTPLSLLTVGPAGSTSSASGITLGGDAEVNLYRVAENTLQTDAAFQAVGSIYSASYFYTAVGQIYGSTYGNLTLFVGNSAGNAWQEGMFIKRGSYVGIGTTNPTGKLHVVSSVAGETVLRTDGTNGTLFSVVDDLSDSLMSVNNSAGLPVLEVFADDRVVAGQYGSGDFVLINNKVGLGTSNPANKLTVIGAASIGSSTYNVAAPSNGLIVEGNVGIGTTNPSYKLDVSASVTNVGRFYNNQTTLVLNVGSTNNTEYTDLALFTSNGNAQFFKNRSSTSWGGTDSLNIYTSNGAITFHPAGTQNAVYIDSNGSVGINKTAPTTKLDVVGSFRVVGTTNIGGIFVTGSSASQGNIRPAVNNGSVLISDDSGSSTRGLTVSNGGGAIISSVDANYDILTLQIGGTTNHTFDRNGNVGIGLTAPNAARLHIKGNNSDPVLRVESASLVAGTSTASKTFVGWMPIMTGSAAGDKVFIPLFKN